MNDSDDIVSYLAENEEYREIVKKAIEFEESNPKPDSNFTEDEPQDSHWQYDEVRAHPTRLEQLVIKGVVTKVFDSNSRTEYALTDREQAKELLEQAEEKANQTQGFKKAIHNFPSEDELNGVFDDVVGYEDVKFLLKRAMSAEDITNILLVGPPGSAKTVFLMCINKLDDSIFTSGDPTTGPGFFDLMFEEEPKFVAIDELDQMDTDDQEALSDYTETGMLVETKGNNKRRKMETNTKTFAAANHTDKILDNIENRFLDLHFEPYDRDEFLEVCTHILPKNEGKSEEEAIQIAEAVWEMEGSGNVRKAIQVSRLSRGDPGKVLEVLGEYAGSSGKLLG